MKDHADQMQEEFQSRQERYERALEIAAGKWTEALWDDPWGMMSDYISGNYDKVGKLWEAAVWGNGQAVTQIREAARAEYVEVEAERLMESGEV